MRTGIVPQAAAAAAQMRDAHRLRTFEHAASEFARVLGGVPDCAAHEISDTEVVALQQLAEGIIDQIETRLSSGADPSGSQPALASRVYEIRRLLEEVHSWRRHYYAGRP